MAQTRFKWKKIWKKFDRKFKDAEDCDVYLSWKEQKRLITKIVEKELHSYLYD